MAMPKNYFEGTEFTDSIANEKRALLALIAERGAEGQADYDRAKTLSDSARASSLEGAAARGYHVNAPAAVQAGIKQDYDKINMAYRDAMAQSQLGHGREMDRIALANSSYKDAMIAQQPQFQSAMDAQIRALQLELAARAAGRGGGGGGGGGGGMQYPAMPDTVAAQEAIDAEKANPASPVNLGIDEGLLWSAPNPHLRFQRTPAKKPTSSSSTGGARRSGSGSFGRPGAETNPFKRAIQALANPITRRMGQAVGRQ